MTELNRGFVASLPEHILRHLESILLECEEEVRPLELNPARQELFELFVTAHGAGFLEEGAAVDLTAESLCRLLAARWGLDAAAQSSVASQQKLSGQEVGRMRLLWSLMRMWMEWTYAWERWEEFHGGEPRSASSEDSESNLESEQQADDFAEDEEV